TQTRAGATATCCPNSNAQRGYELSSWRFMTPLSACHHIAGTDFTEILRTGNLCVIPKAKLVQPEQSQPREIRAIFLCEGYCWYVDRADVCLAIVKGGSDGRRLAADFRDYRYSPILAGGRVGRRHHQGAR